MASSVKLHPRPAGATSSAPNPLPQLIQTPAGMALLELQGTINLPQTDPEQEGQAPEIPIGRITFPDYNPNALDPSNTSWMRRVHLYVGQHQRLTGEVKKLPKAMAIIRRRASDEAAGTGAAEDKIEDLEVVEIVKHKLIFSSRPEPVGTS
ncbi:chromosome transmission fidelity protein 8 [Pestalotiopsis sp. NC0098]|nr:chromosome transmission fidelity protein 8 [Pestalotiopsis sp. NC0098]